MKFVLIMLMLASSALAQEYVKVHSDDTASYYVDKTSVKTEKGFYSFTGKAENATTVMLTSFVTDCKTYMVLFEKAITEEDVLTRQKLKPEVKAVPENTALSLAIDYVCGAKPKSPLRLNIPEAR